MELFEEAVEARQAKILLLIEWIDRNNKIYSALELCLNAKLQARKTEKRNFSVICSTFIVGSPEVLKLLFSPALVRLSVGSWKRQLIEQKSLMQIYIISFRFPSSNNISTIKLKSFLFARLARSIVCFSYLHWSSTWFELIKEKGKKSSNNQVGSENGEVNNERRALCTLSVRGLIDFATFLGTFELSVNDVRLSSDQSERVLSSDCCWLYERMNGNFCQMLLKSFRHFVDSLGFCTRSGHFRKQCQLQQVRLKGLTGRFTCLHLLMGRENLHPLPRTFLLMNYRRQVNCFL